MFLKKAFKKAGDSLKKVGNAVGEGIKKVGNAIKSGFNKLTKRERRRKVKQVVPLLNGCIKNLGKLTPAYSLIKEGKLPRADNDIIRDKLLEGLTINLQEAKKRCEKKFKKGNCVLKGKYAYAYACDKGYAPVWTDPLKKTKFQCRKPDSLAQMKEHVGEISKKNRKNLTEVFEAFFYEILDG